MVRESSGDAVIGFGSNANSCQPCGCDPGCISPYTGMGYVCARHRAEWEAFQEDHLGVTPDVLSATENAPVPAKGTAEWRKQRPLWSGVMKYFPDALLEVAHVSWVGNEQHNPGERLYWNRAKSSDEQDACARHLTEAGTRDSDGTRHSAKAAWRALAMLQKEIESEQ